MTRIDPSRMAEATRLTRAGRLGEATALIQQMLSGKQAPSAPSDGWAGPTLDLRAEPEPEARPRSKRAPGPPPGSERVPEPSPAPADTGRRLPGAWTTHTYANPFGRRSYKLYLPERRAGVALPLVVMLHGCTQKPDDFARGTRLNGLGEQLGFIVAYPGQTRTANPTRCWNWFRPTDQERERGELSLIAGITRAVIAEHGVDPARVYVAGLSAGGAAAALMARAYPDLCAAVGVHSGVAPGAASDVASALAAMRAPEGRQDIGEGGPVVPTIVFHGTADKTVNPANADAVVRHALGSARGLERVTERGRCDGGYSYRVTRHRDGDARTLVEDWRIDGLGHAWSGGDRKGSFTDPQGPDASRIMLDFFLRQRLGRAG